MRLLVGRQDGATDTLDATPEVVEWALGKLGSSFRYVVCEDGRRFLQDSGDLLEYGERKRLFRAHPMSREIRGSLPAFRAFVERDDRWRTDYRWEEVTAELRLDGRRFPWRRVLVVILLAALATAVVRLL